jgi:Uma2 family endonuclease
MMHSVAAPELTTVADLIDALGGVPPERIRLHPTPGTATEQDVIDLHDRQNRLFELVDGVLVEKAMGYYESLLAAVLLQLLRNFADEHQLGPVAGADGMMRLTAGLVRIPDVSFISWDKFPNHQIPREPIPDLAPELAVEVLSKSNTPQEIARKIDEYFAAGTQLVWILDPPPRTITVFTTPNRSTTIGESDILDGGSVLPGFAVRLREIFERAGPPASTQA